jgi:hypothetical protein
MVVSPITPTTGFLDSADAYPCIHMSRARRALVSLNGSD